MNQTGFNTINERVTMAKSKGEKNKLRKLQNDLKRARKAAILFNKFIKGI